jgi:Low-density lipoprotein receptor domain class A
MICGNGNIIPSISTGKYFNLLHPVSNGNLHFFYNLFSVSKDFRILFEIVPNNLSGALRGHVSIDNLKMRNCFAESPRKDACSMSQIKCNESRIAVCIENSRVCDLVDDCDDAEDEKLNCG